MKSDKKLITSIAIVLFILVAMFLIYNLGFSFGQFVAKVSK